MQIARSTLIGSSVLAIALTGVGCAGGAGLETEVESAALTSPTAVSNVAPSGLIQSTGNLYWTANGHTRLPNAYWARVYRTGKYDLPGSETILYSESSSFLPISFGDITWAYVGGNYFAYFVANETSGTYIKRVSLSGGSATVMTTAPNGITKNTLVNDGSSLYWADSAGLHQTDPSSGATYQLNSVTGIKSVAVEGGSPVAFTDGSSVYYWTPTGAGTLYTSFGGISPPLIAGGSPLYWFEGALYSFYNNQTHFITYPNQNSIVTSLSSGGGWVVWTDCDVSTNACEVTSNAPTGGSIGVGNGARLAQGDSSAIFFGTDSGVFRTHY